MASRSINSVEILGHLGSDAEVKFTPRGKKVAQFTVATAHRWKPDGSDEWKEETEWHRCVLWQCENVSSYLVKGKQVLCKGRLKTRSYEDSERIKRYVTEIIVDELFLLGGGQRGEGE